MPMKHHLLLAVFLGTLTVGYTLVAPVSAQEPDSVDAIAYSVEDIENFIRMNSRFVSPPTNVDTPTVRVRGLTALV